MQNVPTVSQVIVFSEQILILPFWKFLSDMT